LSKVIIVLSINIIIVSSVYLWFDQHKRSSNLLYNKPVAILLEKHNKVKKRNQTKIGWQIIHQGEELLEQDILSTSQNSNADISLQDNTRIFLCSHTRLALHLNQQRPYIELLAGNIIIDRKGLEKPSWHLKSRGTIINLLKSTTQFNIEDNSDNSLIVLKGEINFNPPIDLSGSSQQKSKTGDIVIIHPNGKTQIKPNVQPYLLSPHMNEVILTTSRTHMTKFIWNSKEVLNTVFQLSNSPLFNTLLMEKIFQEESDVQLKLSSGTYYWRVLNRSSIITENKNSAFYKFKIIKETPISILTPSNNSEFKQKPQLNIPFMWTTSPSIIQSKIQLYKDVYSKILQWESDYISMRNPRYTVSLPDLPVGTYYARILGRRSQYPGQVFSRAVSLKILPTKNNNTSSNFPYSSNSTNNGSNTSNYPDSRPTFSSNNVNISGQLNLIYPPINHIHPLPYGNNNKNNNKNSRKKKSRLYFSWTASNNATEYLFLFLKADKTVLKEKRTQKNSLILPMNQPGEYYWQIVSYNKKKEKIGTSTKRKLKVIAFDPLPAPQVYRPSLDKSEKKKSKQR